MEQQKQREVKSLDDAKPLVTVVGLMSGTSLDGVDAAIIRTDGREVIEPLGFATLPYDAAFRQRLRSCLGGKQTEQIPEIEQDLTDLHAKAVRHLLDQMKLDTSDIDLVGFHGHTLAHDPAHRFTWQIGDGDRLAADLNLAVVNQFRQHDVAAGGQGAPLVPLYHQARLGKQGRPAAILNIGGVANVTWLGLGERDIMGFDSGPGGALLDDWVMRHTGMPFDRNGQLARQGKIHHDQLNTWLDQPYFHRAPPKSLDRDELHTPGLESLSPEDGAATLTAFSARAIGRCLSHLPQRPSALYVTGGGRHNAYMAEMISTACDMPVAAVETLGWNGDALEAEAFAWMAVRSVNHLPLSVPETTGVPEPMTGGVIHMAA
ncbi:MAG: anhydro-N-acetylmuramic acid kinase [Alphaproteobacteria bacterium]|nr:MAG: anhydro-N-acetylmuramic acid kinase [Alphaproteobacteria bacterium]